MRLDTFGKSIDHGKDSPYDNMNSLNRRRAGFLSTADVLVSVSEPRKNSADEKDNLEYTL